MLLQKLSAYCNINFTSYEPVSGGDINKSYCLYDEISQKYFLKTNDAGLYPEMFKTEASGLKILNTHTLLIIPQVINCGIIDGQQYLFLEWIEKGKPRLDCMEKFGSGLAFMHRQTNSYFGLEEANYIGSLPQINTPHKCWGEFYSECRIIPLVKKLFDSGNFSEKDILHAEQLGKKLDELFPDEPPALLHGDLWSGNYMIASSGYVAMYDPAVYYGHREMDMGMTRLFGGFDQQFYQAYHEVYPLRAGWEKRLPLAQLYPLLVHAVLFGGYYISNAREIIRQFC